MSKKNTKMDPEETVTISKEEYKELLADREILELFIDRKLEAAGVDGWDGYGNAQDTMDD